MVFLCAFFNIIRKHGYTLDMGTKTMMSNERMRDLPMP